MRKLIYNLIKCLKCNYTLTNIYLEGCEEHKIDEYTCFNCRKGKEKYNYKLKKGKLNLEGYRIKYILS